ncbi:unnamed protein product [Lepeophtheirus salmonis]|uniref:(salmon louse) hypothetical protein n=1 Tax=Lepeophtheirus salmonis TaxID=72036 RepID=A0A7R8H3B1_LEPSM|nr:unnamed protein product [Lepeophtheirus salmonis]CAF2841519.1 unnamed protein product [Lepeophtheirus salmonis]
MGWDVRGKRHVVDAEYFESPSLGSCSWAWRMDVVGDEGSLIRVESSQVIHSSLESQECIHCFPLHLILMKQCTYDSREEILQKCLHSLTPPIDSLTSHSLSSVFS